MSLGTICAGILLVAFVAVGLRSPPIYPGYVSRIASAPNLPILKGQCGQADEDGGRRWHRIECPKLGEQK